MIFKHVGFKSFIELVKAEGNIDTSKFKLKGRGYNKQYKHYFEVETI